MLFEFGSFILDTQQHELRRSGVVCPIEPKAFRVLSYLLTYRDRTVSKEELLDNCWEGEFVTESALSRCLKVIRQAVGDDGTRQHVIKTRRGYGYRFVAEVSCHDTTMEPEETPLTERHRPYERVEDEELPCPQCQSINRSTSQFCSQCGQALRQPCPACGFRNAPVALFCGGCAHSLPQSDQTIPAAVPAEQPSGTPAAASRERKLVTILVATLHGLDALDDLEEADDIVTQAMGQFVTEVQRVEGFVPQIAGHSLIALFGAPIACEDHVLRALHAAFSLQRALAQMVPRWHHHELLLKLQSVLHTGPVIAGNMDSDVHVQALTQGTTCQTAMHMQQQTSATTLDHTIFVSDPVRQQASGYFTFIDYDHLTISTARRPVHVSTCIEPLPAASRLDVALARQHTAFFGRSDEMTLLHGLWARACRAEGQVVCLAGEAGIGKSRLAYEYRQTLSHAHCLTMQALSYGTAMPYHAWLPLLRTLLGIDAHAPLGRQSRQMNLGLASLSPALAADAPLFTDLLGLPDAGSETLFPLSPSARKQRLHDACIELLLRTAADRPVCLLVEDGHWLDPSSLEVLNGLVMALANQPMLLLCTARPGFRPVWSEYSFYHQLAIAPLAGNEIDALLQALLAPHRPSAALQVQVRERTSGNPFFIEETVRAMQQSGLLEHRDGICELRHPQSITLPGSIQGMVQARLDCLPKDAKALLHLAAVLGAEAPVPLLGAMADLPLGQVQQQVLHLTSSELLYEAQRVPVPTYVFKHVLVQKAVYQSLAKRQRQQAHRQAAHVLETQFPQRATTEPEVVAQHYTAACEPEAAIPYWHRAGQLATARSAYVEALSHLKQGLALLTALHDTPARIRHELALKASLGPILMTTKGHAAPEVGDAYTRARELCAWVENTPELFPILAGLAKFSITRAELETAYNVGQHCLRQAEHNHEPVQLTIAHWILGASLFWQGTMVTAHKHMQTGLARFVPETYRIQLERYPVVPGVQCLSYMALTSWYMGYPDQAIQHGHEAIALAQEMAHPYSLAMAYFYTARLHYLRRDIGATAEHAEALQQLSAEQELAFWLAQAIMLKGWAHMHTDPEASMAQIRQGLAEYEGTGAELGIEFFLSLLAECAWQVGQRDVARQTLHEAQQVARTKGARYCESDFMRLESDWALQCAFVNADGIESRLQQALMLSRHQKAKSLELRIALSLCHLWRQQDKLAQAHQLLTGIYSEFTEGFDTGDLLDAKHLLDLLGTS